jgi:hypothetical protein
MKLAGRIALVTGAQQGTGAAIAVTLAAVKFRCRVNPCYLHAYGAGRDSPVASHRLTLQRDRGYPESNANVGLHPLGWRSQMS